MISQLDAAHAGHARGRSETFNRKRITLVSQPPNGLAISWRSSIEREEASERAFGEANVCSIIIGMIDSELKQLEQ